MQVGDSVSSRQQDEEEKRNLRLQENQLIEQIMQGDGTMKQKVQLWAQILEKRHELLDESLPKDFTVQQISTYISRTLRSLNHPIAHWVSEYLPDK